MASFRGKILGSQDGVDLLYAHHVDLTALGIEARLRVVIEERIQAGAIDEDIRGSEDAQTPRFLAAGVAVAGTEVGVEVSGAGCEAAVESCRIGLHVWRFGLDDTRVDILRVGKLKVVELAVLGARAIHPDGSLRFDEDAPSIVNVDLVVIGEVKLVVRDPEPVIFEVAGRFGGDVQEQKGTLAGRIVVGRDVRVLCTGIALQACSRRAPNAHVNIPHARGTLRGLGDIPLDHDCAWGWALGLKD